MSNFPAVWKAPPWNVPLILEAQLIHLPAAATPITIWDSSRMEDNNPLGDPKFLESPNYAFASTALLPKD